MNKVTKKIFNKNKIHNIKNFNAKLKIKQKLNN